MTLANESSEDHPGTPGRGSPLAAELRIALVRCVRRIRAEKSAHELNDGQCAVLAVLDRHGAMTPRALADHEGVRPPSMTRIITALGEQGLIRRQDDPSDGRQILIRLTEAGTRTLRETRHRRNVWLEHRLSELGEDDLAVLARAVAVLTRIADS